ncbi:D-sedoheptulose 7-phosphate isomerase [Pseudonocardia endophytica]|uniref:D-sedoheptulose 7-phosphate isomerase n=1 Tax=Pseudonocardia endophytica TaxID=401976 RepID=A0A4R1HNW1_PSEEN|nr:D-sedoheptulose 7-phosphate isomerase [Pseudonocardia endophytica]
MTAAFARRRDPVAALATDADRLAAACRAMAGRFRDGGRLLAAGRGLSAADAAHVVVEFVHPVIVGTRALPALELPDGGSADSVALFGEPGDVLLVFAPDGVDPDLTGALAAADDMLTIALTGPSPARADHVLVVPSDDPRVVREAHVTTYHVLWELVHVYLAGGVP